jgi:hypothetical protein
MRQWSYAVAMVLGVLGAAGAARAEQVDNFYYEAWSKFKPGASVTLRDVLEIKIDEIKQTSNMETTTTYTLEKVLPEKVQLHVTQMVTANGRTRPLPAQTMVIPAQAEKGQEMVSMHVEGARPVKQLITDVSEKKEYVEVSGVRVYATMRQYTIMGETASVSKVKTWYLPEVPGGVVKVESRTEGAVQSTDKMQLMEFQPEKGVKGKLEEAATRPGGAGQEGK